MIKIAIFVAIIMNKTSIKERLNKNIIFGIALTLLLTLTAFCTFNNYKFLTNFATNIESNGNGDRQKDIYTTYYNVKYDSGFFQNNAMNYPYGGDIRNSGCQYHVSIPLKILKNLGISGTESLVIPLINLWIIISIFLSSIFLFFIFRELKIQNIFAALFAVLITFISPQFARICCHITLSYVFVIPCILWFILLFHKKKKYYISVILGLLMFLVGIIHPYYLAFYAALINFYWLFVIIKKRKEYGIKKILLHYNIQFIIPAILYILFSKIQYSINDSTGIPDGYFWYSARFEGLIFPFFKTWFVESIRGIKKIERETWSYLGIIGVFTLFGILIHFFIKLFKGKFKSLVKYTDNELLNLFFSCSVILFLYATCVPLQWFPEKTLNYLGPLAQFRAMGRFLWLPFYVINIIAVYYIYNFATKQKKYLYYIILLLTCAVLSFDAYFNFDTQKKKIIDTDPLICDYKNELEGNKWINNIDIDKYQAILPLPYFNIGSEEYAILNKENIFYKSTYVSMKTGLSLCSNLSARSSISEAYKSASIIHNPYKEFSIIKDFPNKKDLLVISETNTDSLSENEKRILKYSKFLFTANDINFYELKLSDISTLISDYKKEMKEKYSESRKFKITENIYTKDSCEKFYFLSYDNLENKFSYCGKSSLKKDLSEKIILFDSLIPVKYPNEIEISFWVSDIRKEFYGRTIFRIELYDSNGEKIEGDYYNRLSFGIREIDNEWSLCKTDFMIPEEAKSLRIYTENRLTLKNDIYFDNFLIRTKNQNIIIEDQEKNIYLFNNEIVEK